ncbi:MAG TPA: hypothetical protein VGN12_03535 [Pirellulales bacterium]
MKITRYLSPVVAYFAVLGSLTDAICAPPQWKANLIESLQTEMPAGWRATLANGQIRIDRAEPVLVYNAIGLPGFLDDAAQDRYIRSIARRTTFVIELQPGDPMSDEEFSKAFNGNDAAVERARAATADPKLLPDQAFWKAHLEYGYKKLPTFRYENQSVFMNCPYLGAPWNVWPSKTAIECQDVVDVIGRKFSRYRREIDRQ